ncbi:MULTISPECIES: tyrosine-protein phosphatase [Staphylococcus]|uniref:Tyrosine-protein phosphatase n=1 Tax=Staphylococcus haemolyticus (strain JCSC1435) TaxID=279808 RepID=Q4L9H6_STAHJ|nr:MULTISPECIES: CpsB/CapC family capsule biosynthesis tyrosine phosphatase [Staphylococcus]AYX85201.1 capsular biosynthesis protein [Staphylococcus haemolyticus]MBW3857459.1 capsular biosynthesis protein [Staphylococcus haemolyticus]MBW5902817.1 capsular biosynthesis protein [Staphylococcus haemolyticus]MCH4417174.1 capsular biosynthesis protein [Staphylococcus haemolyticus]MCH4504058.1 capsular biosynthesis protein [Staphylococcus haemolyticus]
MIDIHNHILIDVDDGPKTKEDAIALLKQANDEGVTEIIATPHHLSPTFDNAYENVQQKLNQLSELQETKDLGIKLYPGQEIRISDQVLPQLRKGEAIGLNHSRYLLIEFPSRGVPHYANRLFFELQSEGYIPIIAHPERNKEISQNLDVLYNLINQGALAQLTSSSLQGIQGKKIQKISIQMIENNLVHFIASDAHHESQRPFIMKSLYNNKKLKKYEKNIENLINNAKYIVNDEDVIKKQPTQNYNDRKLFGLF